MLSHSAGHGGNSMAPGSSSCRRRPKPARSPARWRRPGSIWCWRATAVAELEAALGAGRVHGLLPQRDDARCVLSRRAAAQAGAAAERRLRRRRPRGGAAGQGAGLQQRRRQRHLGGRARHHADAHRGAQGGLAARQRGGRALARQRPGAAHVRAVRQDARHRRPRHHRQEGGAAGEGLRHARAVLRHRAAERGRGGRTRREVPPAARAAAHLRLRLAATCRSTPPPGT